MSTKILAMSLFAAFGMAALATPGQAAPTCAAQLTAVKAELGRAEFGVMKDEAKMQIARAEQAMASRHDAACITALNQASDFIAKSLDDGANR